MSLDIHDAYTALSIVLADHVDKLMKSREDCTFLLHEMMCKYKTKVWTMGFNIVFDYINECIGIHGTNTKVSVSIGPTTEKINGDTIVVYKDKGEMYINFEYHNMFACVVIFRENSIYTIVDKSYLSLADANSLIMEIDNYLANQPENQ